MIIVLVIFTKKKELKKLICHPPLSPPPPPAYENRPSPFQKLISITYVVYKMKTMSYNQDTVKLNQSLEH